MNNKGVDIIIPIYNAYDDLKICVESIFKYSNLEDNRLLLIDDNSTDERINPYLQSIKKDHVIVITNDQNLGFSHNINIGMKQSGFWVNN